MKILAILVLFSACASLKPNHDFCKESDWREMGMKDAKADKNLEESFHKYKKMCAGFDEKEMKPDVTMYRFGHSTGVKKLCTYTKGREFGLKQKITANNCSKKQHKNFYRGITDGVNEYCEYDAGYKEALKGIVTSRVCIKGKHNKFYKGVLAGKKTYCTYQYGVNIGKQDMEYTGVCSAKAEQEFMKGFTVGKNQSEIARLRLTTRKLEISNAKLSEKINSLNKENSDLRNQVIRYKNDNADMKREMKRRQKESSVLY